MAPDKDPFADSPYDAAGMPLGTTYADYDSTEERRKNQVKTRPVVNPESLNDIDYKPEETEAEKEFKKRRNVDPALFNTAHEQPLKEQPKGDEFEAILEEEAKKLKAEKAEDKK